MTAARANPILQRLRRLAVEGAAVLSDADLLQCYLDRRDESAFAALVERHGRLVLGVCRTILRHEHDAEDAFQATFLVLARQAHAIRRRDNLGSFLHGVAYRVAQKARTATARRQALEARATPAAPVPSADDLSWGEVRAVLHAELAALPERWGAPLVLCYLEGLTQEDAARRLGWTTTTLKGRLQRGRERLRRRLQRRGLGLAILGAAALTGDAGAAPVPAALAAAAVRAALPLAGQTPPPGVAALASKGSGPLVPVKLRIATAVLLTVVTLAASVAFCSRQPTPAEPAHPDPGPSAAVPAAATDFFGDPLPDGAVARLGTARFNHGDGLNALYFTPDGKTILSEGNGFLHHWDAVTGKELARHTLAKPSFDDQTVLTPDGTMLVSLNQDGFTEDHARFWDLAQRKEVRLVPLPVQRKEISIFRRNALAPDGRLAVVHAPDAVRVFDLMTTKELYRLPKGNDAVRVATFAGSDRIVTADRKQLIEVWEARTGKLVRQFAHGAPVEVIVASPDGRRLATLEHHTTAIDRLLDRDVVRVWDLTAGTVQHTLTARPQRWFMSAHFSPDGKLLFASSFGRDGYELTVWDAETGRRIHDLAGVSSGALAVSPDGGRLAAGSMGKFDLWDLHTGRRLSDADAPHAYSAAVFLSPTGDRVCTVGYETLSTWDGKTGRRAGSFDLPPYPSSGPERTYSPDGHYALSFAGDFQQIEIILWDVAAGRRLHTLRSPGASGQTSSAFAPDSSLLATWQPGQKNIVHLWDVQTGREVRSFEEKQAGWPGRLFFTPDGKTLVVAGRRTVGYDVGSGRELFSWRMKPLPDNSGIRTAAVGSPPPSEENRLAWRMLTMSPDGKTVACVLNGEVFTREQVPDRIVLCDARTGKVRRRWSDSGIPGRMWEQLVFSPDSRLLATSDDAVVHVWEAVTGREVRSFRGHGNGIHALAFSADGRRLASASYDSTVMIWDVTLSSQDSGNPGAEQLAAWWADLIGADAGRAYAAVWRLAETPGAAVPFLRQRLQPVTEAEVKAVRQAIADLDSDTFAVRDKARHQLERLGAAAEPALREAREKKTSAEVRRRVEELLEAVSTGPVSGEPLRTVRALAVLEHAGTPEARQLLKELAEGTPGAWLTQEARAAQVRAGPTPSARP
jgi:RNA polymerase sigma factor (sigma-70 family)